MPDLYRIANWDELFEVSSGGHPWAPGQTKRVGPIPYARLQVRGSKWTPGYRNMLHLSKPDGAAVYGVYVKLVELAADEESSERGGIWKSQGIPATPAEIAKQLTGFSVKHVEKALEVLTAQGVAWITKEPFPEIPAHSRPFPESPGISGTLLETKPNQDKDKAEITQENDPETSGPDGLTASVCAEVWNDMAKPLGLKRCENMGTTRTKNFNTRRKERYFQEHWREAIDAIPRLKPNYFGENKTNWSINIDFFLTAEGVAKIIEDAQAPTSRPPEPGVFVREDNFDIGDDDG